MALNETRHIIEEIETVRCSIIEKGIPQGRMKFLKNILECNGYEVRVQKVDNEEKAELYVVGVTDVTFNAVLAVYAHALKTPDNKIITLAYWNQRVKTPDDLYYWSK